MKKEYDFSNAEQGKFFVPVEDVQFPIYLDQDILQYLRKISGDHFDDVQLLVNDLLRQDIEIANRFSKAQGAI